MLGRVDLQQIPEESSEAFLWRRRPTDSLKKTKKTCINQRELLLQSLSSQRRPPCSNAARQWWDVRTMERLISAHTKGPARHFAVWPSRLLTAGQHALPNAARNCFNKPEPVRFKHTSVKHRQHVLCKQPRSRGCVHACHCSITLMSAATVCWVKSATSHSSSTWRFQAKEKKLTVFLSGWPFRLAPMAFCLDCWKLDIAAASSLLQARLHPVAVAPNSCVLCLKGQVCTAFIITAQCVGVDACKWNHFSTSFNVGPTEQVARLWKQHHPAHHMWFSSTRKASTRCCYMKWMTACLVGCPSRLEEGGGARLQVQPFKMIELWMTVLVWVNRPLFAENQTKKGEKIIISTLLPLIDLLAILLINQLLWIRFF